jgi:hypothetical protein
MFYSSTLPPTTSFRKQRNALGATSLFPFPSAKSPKQQSSLINNLPEHQTSPTTQPPPPTTINFRRHQQYHRQRPTKPSNNQPLPLYRIPFFNLQ